MNKFQIIVYRVTSKIFSKVMSIVSLPDSITMHRIMLSRRMQNQLNGIVSRGHFEGVKLPRSMSWGEADRISMLLGFYELEVIEAIYNSPVEYDTFIDLGAADGYYAVGGLVSKRFKNAICFEMSLERQLVIQKNAVDNNVSNSIDIRGAADSSFIDNGIEKYLDRSVVLIDIEGAEFDLLTSLVLKKLSKAIVIIEIHDHLVDDGNKKLDELLSCAEKYFDLKVIRTGYRNPSQYSELKNFSDNDRWLVCSEGRKRAGLWLHLTPVDK
jgi:hypothetical protein